MWVSTSSLHSAHNVYGDIKSVDLLKSSFITKFWNTQFFRIAEEKQKPELTPNLFLYYAWARSFWNPWAKWANPYPCLCEAYGACHCQTLSSLSKRLRVDSVRATTVTHTMWLSKGHFGLANIGIIVCEYHMYLFILCVPCECLEVKDGWITMWVLRAEARSSARTAPSLDHCIISPASPCSYNFNPDLIMRFQVLNSCYITSHS